MDYTFESVNCNICDKDNYETISNKGQFGFETNVVLCKNCGLGYLNPRWTKDTYLNFYTNEYDKYYRPNVQKNKAIKSKTDPAILRLKNQNILNKDIKSILDIGSGEGKILNDLQKILPNGNYFAIEPSLKSQEYLKDLGIKIVSDDIDSSWDKEYSQKFDLIIMRHVLEHFMNPSKSMLKIRSVLSEKGIIYVAVPNNLNPIHSLEKSWFRVVHTYYFNKYSLTNLFESCGFNVKHVIEGDDYNMGEIVLLLEKSKINKNISFNNEHYIRQRDVFKNKLKEDKNIMSLVKKKIKRAISKL